MCDRRDGRERLAPETQRRDAFEVFGPPDLARGVALDRAPGIFRLHPLDIGFDVNQLLATKLDGNGDAPRARIDRVLDELLDDRRRALDDLAGGNLVGEVAWKHVNSRHVRATPCAETAPA